MQTFRPGGEANLSSEAVRQHGPTPDSVRGGMERAAVDRQARTAKLQDELNATAKEMGRAMYADWRARWPEVRDCLRSKQRGCLSGKVKTLPSPPADRGMRSCWRYAFGMVFLNESGDFNSTDFMCMAGFIATDQGCSDLCMALSVAGEIQDIRAGPQTIRS
jgi:hypothetical protein